MNLSSEDRDNVIRTVIGEVDPNDPDQGRAAVAHVILNRVASGRYGDSASSVVHQRGQFEPWMTRAKQLNAIKPDSPEYQRVADIVDGVTGGKIPDPTGGATHFLDRNVTAGRPGGIGKLAPWADKAPMLAQIGGHSFYAPEGTASAEDRDLLDLYTKPQTKSAQAPTSAPAKAGQTTSDDDLLKAYTGPATAAAPVAAPQMIGNRVVDPSEVTPGATPVAPVATEQPSILHRIHSALDFSTPVATHTGEAFEAGSQLAQSGAKDYREGNPYPSFPSTDPKTWGAGGLVKTAAGVLGMATSPISGMAQTFVGDPVTQATGNPDIGDRASMIATLPVGGGAAVGGGKLAVAGGKLAATTAVNTARKLSAPTSAVDKLVEMVGPQNVPAVVQRLKDNPRLNVMDASDPVRVAAQGLIDPSQPEAHQILASASKERTASAPAANNAAYSSTLGPVPDVIKTVEGLKKKAQDVGSQVIDPVVKGAPAVDITSTIQHIDKQIGPRVLRAVREGRDPGVPLTDTQRDYLDLRGRLRGEMPDAPSSKGVSSKMFMDASQVHEIQSQLRYEGSTLMKNGGSDALQGSRFMDTRQRLVEALDKVSGEIPVPADHTRYYRLPDSFSGSHGSAWFTTDAAEGRKAGDGKYLDVANSDTATQAKFFGGSGGKQYRVTTDPQVAQSAKPLMGQYKASLGKYRDAKMVQEAFEDGLSTLKNREGMKGLEDRPEYLAQWARNASPEEVEARRMGTRVAIDQKVKSVRNAAKKATDIPDIEFNREKLATLFGKPETDRLFKLMQDAHNEATTDSKIISGSKTAETIAGQKSLQPREVEPFSLKHNPVGIAGALATAGTLHGGLIEGGALGGALLAANVGGALAKRTYQGIARKMDVSRNTEFAKLASATGGATNPTVAKLQNHRSQSNLPVTQPLKRDIIERGRSGRPNVTASLDTTENPVVAYHGTSVDNVKSIQSKGLTSGKSNYPEEVYPSSSHGKLNYLSFDKENARDWAEAAHGKEKARVLEIHIPRDHPNLERYDDEGTFRGTIPPKWVKGPVDDTQPLKRDIIERGRSGRPNVTLPNDLGKLRNAVFNRGNAISTKDPASINMGRLLYRDTNHLDPYEKAISEFGSKDFEKITKYQDDPSGFVTDTGFHVDRKTAMKIAKKARQLHGKPWRSLNNSLGEDSLGSEDLK